MLNYRVLALRAFHKKAQSCRVAATMGGNLRTPLPGVATQAAALVYPITSPSGYCNYPHNTKGAMHPLRHGIDIFSLTKRSCSVNLEIGS